VSAANGGALDFYQVHTYATPSGAFAPSSPMALPSASAYALRKPLVIGEFSAAKCTHPARSVESLYAHALAGGYAGAWDWVLQGSDGNDDAATCARGMRSIASSPKVRFVARAVSCCPPLEAHLVRSAVAHAALPRPRTQPPPGQGRHRRGATARHVRVLRRCPARAVHVRAAGWVGQVLLVLHEGFLLPLLPRLHGLLVDTDQCSQALHNHVVVR
jgi:hypothetical protein